MGVIKDVAERHKITLKETAEVNLPSTQDAVEAADSVLIYEQAALLRECRLALDCLLKDKPMLAAKVCGSTTLGNLRASLYGYRPQGISGVEKH